MMQFNMYHHYTVDEHLLRCIGILQEIERGSVKDSTLANELIHKILPAHRRVLYVALFLHDIAKGRPEDHSTAGARVAKRFCPRFGFSPAETELTAWLIEHHLVMSSVAQSRDLSDRKTIENFTAVVQSAERLKLLTILTTADIKGVGPGVWNGWKAQLIRTLYYETEPAVTGGFSEINRVQRVAMAQDEFREAMTDWPPEKLEAYIAMLYPAYWLKVDLAHKIEHARFVAAAGEAGKTLATTLDFDAERGVTELTVLAPTIPGCCRSSPAPARSPAPTSWTRRSTPPPTDARSTPYRSTVNSTATRTSSAAPRASPIRSRRRCAANCGCPRLWPSAPQPKGRIRAFAVEPSITINNQWSHRYTMVEVTGLDRTGLLYELTATLSKLNLNIASAHVATFGERVIDVFYVTDLLGAQITSPTRQAAIKRALISLFARHEEGKAT